MLIERVKSGFELIGNGERVAGQLPLFRHVLADVLPKISEDRNLGAGNVVGDRHARQLHDSAFDGVDEGEVADGPGKKRSLGPARPGKKERRRGEIVDGADAELALEGLDPIDPEAGGLVIFLRFLLFVALEDSPVDLLPDSYGSNDGPHH